MPWVGSNSSRVRNPAASQRPMVSFCWFPPERRRAWAAARVSMDSRVTASLTWRRSRPALIGPQRPTRLNSGIAMFSRGWAAAAAGPAAGCWAPGRPRAGWRHRGAGPAAAGRRRRSRRRRPGRSRRGSRTAGPGPGPRGRQPQDLAGGDLEGDAGVLPVDQEVAHDQPLGAPPRPWRPAPGRRRGPRRRPRRAWQRRSGTPALAAGVEGDDVAAVTQDGAHVAVLAQLGQPVGDEQHRPAAPLPAAP